LVSAEVIAKLPRVLKPISNEQGANAAVALLLKPKLDDFDMLLVKRVENPSDTWSGQMALPGGKLEPKDANLQETVTRETFEETGVKLDQHRLLGVLSSIKSEPKPDFMILPFVVLLEQEPVMKLSKAELEAFIWVPYEEISKCQGTATFRFGEVPAYVLSDAVIWGVTYKILNEFVEAVEKVQE
jgi:ADP-ribose pyrophosphatase YjhB (NUDIX family)